MQRHAPTPPRALHLPDLPEVSVQQGGSGPGVGVDGLALGPPAAGTVGGPSSQPRQRASLGYRLRQALASYLPLLLMGLLAVSTGWLVKNTPQAPAAVADGPPRQDPDYTMTGFAITRFAPDGREQLRISGDVLRHYPLTDQLEIEGVRIRAYAPDGRITDASARRALSNADGSEVQLLGGARVVSQLGGAAGGASGATSGGAAGADTLEVSGEFLHAFLRFERLRSHLPVQVRRAGSDTRAGGLDYDHLARQLRLLGPVRMTLRPGSGPPLGPAALAAPAAAAPAVAAAATATPVTATPVIATPKTPP